MHLRYAVLCDYACPGAHNKAVIVGVYEALFVPKNQPVHTSPCFLHAMIESPAAAGPRHVINHRLIDGDGKTVHEEENALTFVPKTSNPQSQFANIYAFIHPIELLAGVGDYEWVIQIDGMRIGSVPFSVCHIPEGFQFTPTNPPSAP